VLKYSTQPLSIGDGAIEEICPTKELYPHGGSLAAYGEEGVFMAERQSETWATTIR